MPRATQSYQSSGTAGVGLLFPIGCWAALAYDAYNEKDRRHHHHLTSEADDESPD